MSPSATPVTRRDLSVSMAKANLYALLATAPPVVLTIICFRLRWGFQELGRGAAALFDNLLIFLVVLVVGIMVHELLHGLSWALAGRTSLRAIRFGFQLKTLTPYAHCTEPLAVDAYRIGALMPGLLLGIAPSIAGVISGSGVLAAFGLLFTIAAGGDFLILWLLRDVHAGALVEDHPERAGCYVLSSHGAPSER